MVLVKLKQSRLEQNKTCKDIADDVGISKEYYWYIENGQRRLTYDLAVKISAVLATTPDEIFLATELTK